MFIGHFGVGFISKKIDAKPSLGTYFLASQFIDLLWPLFLLLGIEHVNIDPGNTAFTPLDFIYYPFTHGFVSVLIWSVLFAGVYYFLKKDKRSSIILGLVVMSHWFLDLLTHRPDLPLTWWSDFKVGLGLWNSVLLTVIVEGALFLGAVYIYLNFTKAKNKIGSIGTYSLVAFLIVVYVMNLIGPPPPNEQAIGFAGLSMWLIVVWGYWIDRNRMTNK